MKVLFVAGYIDYLGVIHFRIITWKQLSQSSHEELFPHVRQPKQWRFFVGPWSLEENDLSPEHLSAEDREQIPRLMQEILGHLRN